MRIRPAKPEDLPGIEALALEALHKNAIEGLVVSREKVRLMAREVVSGAAHFCWVAVDDDGTVWGSVAAMVDEASFYERKAATVVQFYCKAPGFGIMLLRELRTWFHSRRALKMLTFTLDEACDPRIIKLLKRLGLIRALPIYIEVKS